MAKYTQADFPLTLTISVEESLHRYFKFAEQAFRHFAEYKDRHRTLDYALMHRFIHTTYKTLHDIDSEFMQQKLQLLYSNLEKMAKIYDDFKSKSKQGLHSYANIFLSQQAHYNQYENQLFTNSEEISYLRMQTQRFREAVEKQQVIIQNASVLTGEKHRQEEELKRIKRLENSAIVRFGDLVDQNAVLYDVLTAFKKCYEDEFLAAFDHYVEGKRPLLLYILNAMAFEFDIELWHKSKESPIIQNYFKNAYTGSVLNSRTYLEYYLRNLDDTKLNAENKALKALLKVLQATTALHILIYMANSDDLAVFRSALESDGAGHEVSIFTQAKPALKMALSCSIDVIILDLSLQKNILESYMRTFKEHAVDCESDVRFIFVSDTVDEVSLAYAQELGADSLIERELDAVEILDAIYTLVESKK